MLKRITSMLVAICLLLTALPLQLPVYAAEEETDTRAKLELVYLKQATSNGTTRLEELELGDSLDSILIQDDADSTVGIAGTEREGVTSGLQAGDSFWMGIKISELDDIPDYKSLYAVTTSVVFDTQYFYPLYMDTIGSDNGGSGNGAYVIDWNYLFMPTSVDASYAPGLAADEATTYLKALLPEMTNVTGQGTSSARTALDPYNPNESYNIQANSAYELDSITTNNDLAVDDGTGNKTVPETVKGFKVVYTKTDGQATQVFQQTEGVLAVVRFKVKAVPPNGAKAIGFDFGGDRTTFSYRNAEGGGGANKSVEYGGTSTSINEADKYEYYVETVNTVDPFPIEYTVTYDKNNDNATWVDGEAFTETLTSSGGLKPAYADASGTPVESLIEKPEGYIIKNWYLDADCANGTHTDGCGYVADTTPCSHLVDKSTFEVSTDIATEVDGKYVVTLYAEWAEGYEVIFYPNNGTWDDGTDTSKVFPVETGTAFLTTEKPAISDWVTNPTYTGHTFDDWYLKSGTTFTTLAFDTLNAAQSSGPIEVFAKWDYSDTETTTYTLNFNINTDDANATGAPDPIGYNSGDTLQSVIGGMPVEPTRTDYEFLGWYPTQNGDGEKLTSLTDLEAYTTKYGTDTVYAAWGWLEDGPPEGPETPKDDGTTVQVIFNEMIDADGTPLVTYAYLPVNDKYVQYGEAITGMPPAAGETIIKLADNAELIGWQTGEGSGGETPKEVKENDLLNADLSAYYTEKTALGADGNPITDADGNEVKYKELNLYPIWEDKYTLTFDPNTADGSGGWEQDGTTDLDTTPKVIERGKDEPYLTTGQSITGDPASSLGLGVAIPVRNGYEFKGWYLKTRQDSTFGAKVDDDYLTGLTNTTLTAYAMWVPDGTNTEKDGLLKFDSNLPDGVTGQDAVPPEVGYIAGKSLDEIIGALPTAPTRDDNQGYVFLGWFPTPSGSGNQLLGDKNLGDYVTENAMAKDDDGNYTVYAAWGHIPEPEPTDPPNPTPEPKDGTLIVHFADHPYGDNASTGDGNPEPVNDRYMLYGDKIYNLPDMTPPTDSGKVFNGKWTTMDDGTNGQIVISDGTIMGGSDVTDGPIPDVYFTLQTGTSTDSDGSTVSFNYKEITLYPVWEDPITTVDINFYANEGEWTGQDDTSVKHFDHNPGDKFLQDGEYLYDDDANSIVGKVGKPDRENHTFIGWYLKDADGNYYTQEVTEDDLRQNISDPMDLYAVWQRDPDTVDYVLNFDNNVPSSAVLANGVNPASVAYAYDGATQTGDTLSALLPGMPVAPARNDGYVFKGWYSNPSGDGDALTADDVIGLYADTYGIHVFNADTGKNEATVYARWDFDDTTTPENDETIRVIFNLGTDAEGNTQITEYTYTSITDKLVIYGGTIENFPDPADLSLQGNADAIFGGWVTKPVAPDGSKPVGDTTAIGTDLEAYYESASGDPAYRSLNLYAKWLDTVTINHDANGINSAVIGSITQPQPNIGIGDTFNVGNITFTDGAEYVLHSWNTKPNGTGTTFPKDSVQTLDAALAALVDAEGKVNLYAIWEYTGDDKITVQFHANGTPQFPATLNPADANPTDSSVYTMFRAPGDTITYAQMPDKDRGIEYSFNRWSGASNDPVMDGYDNSTYELELPDAGPETVDQYAIWQATPVTDPDAKVAITFLANYNYQRDGVETDDTGVTPAIAEPAVVTIDLEDSLGGRVLDAPKYDADGWFFKEWNTARDGSGYTVDLNTLFTAGADDGTANDGNVDAAVHVDGKPGAITLYAIWTNEITLTFDPNKGTLDGSTDKVSYTLTSGQTPNDITALGNVLPTPERYGFTFEGWYTDLDGNNILDASEKLELTTVIRESREVTAKWKGNVWLFFEDSEFPYNGDPQTPIKEGNIIVSLTDTKPDADSPNNVTADYSWTDFSGSYRPHLDVLPDGATEDTTAYDNIIRADAGSYDIQPKMTPQVALFEEVILVASPSFYKITPLNVALTLSNDVQTIQDITAANAVTNLGVAVTSITDAEGGTGAPDPVFTMPDPTVADPDFNIIFKEITLGADGKVQRDTTTGDITGIGATAATNAMPTAYGTYLIEFEAVDGKQNYILSSIYDSVMDDATTTEVVEGDDANILYLNPAEWTIEFIDDDPDNPYSTYTIEDGKTIEGDGTYGGVTKVDGTAVTPAGDIKDLPTDPTADSGMMFYGWSMEELTKPTDGDGNTREFTEADFAAGGDYATTPFLEVSTTKADFNTAGQTGNDFKVYAVYVMSNDASLAKAIFQKTVLTDVNSTPTNAEDDEWVADGITLPYGNFTDTTIATLEEIDWTTFTTPTPAIALGADNTYYLLVDEYDMEEIHGQFKPTVEGAKLEISVNGTVLTTDKVDTTTAAGESHITEPINSTEYVVTNPDPLEGYNTTNEVKVKVTAPDGVTERTYTFNILKLVKPTVELEYGNSVYGRIMSDTTLVVENDPVQTEANRQAEKDLFEKYYDGDRLNTNHWYKSPEDPSQLVRYKGDENDYDEYIYFKMIMDDDGESLSCTALVDPGFTAYDEYGRGLAASRVEREITVLRTTLDNNRHFYLELGETGVVEEQPYTARGTDAFEEFHDESRIVPDVYNMFYYLLDAEGNYVLDDDGNKVELGIRKIGVVYPRGDVDLSGSVNVNDTNFMRNEVAEIEGLRLHKKYFYMARISDVDVTGNYNVNDKNAIQNHDKMVSGSEIYNYFTN